MTIAGRLAALALLASLLAGCAYKPLKAPCSADEDSAALASAEKNSPHRPAAFSSLGPCGPLRPI